jgi:hypothetical protein
LKDVKLKEELKGGKKLEINRDGLGENGSERKKVC